MMDGGDAPRQSLISRPGQGLRRWTGSVQSGSLASGQSGNNSTSRSGDGFFERQVVVSVDFVAGGNEFQVVMGPSTLVCCLSEEERLQVWRLIACKRRGGFLGRGRRLGMEEGAWVKAVEQASAGEAIREVEALTLDGLVKCAQGKLPKSKVFAPFTQLKRLSISNVGLSSLRDFPSLPHLERLILSDNRISGGLEHLVCAGLKSLRELDLSNNKIQAVEDLKPLAQLKLELLDLYACPVTRSTDYRAKVFRMMKSLRFLDKTDVTGSERPESEEGETEEEEDVDDFNGDEAELDGEELDFDSNAVAVHGEADEEGEQDKGRDDDNENVEDEKEDEGGSFQEEAVVVASEHGVVQRRLNDKYINDGEEVEDEDDNVEVQDVQEASEEEELGVEDDDDAIVNDEEEEDEGLGSGPHVSPEGDLHVQENEDEDGENGELGEDKEADEVEDDAFINDEVEEEEDEEDEEFGTKYLLQPIGQADEDEGASDFEPGDEEEDEDFEDEEDDGDSVRDPVGLEQNRKRTREEANEEEDRPAKH